MGKDKKRKRPRNRTATRKPYQPPPPKLRLAIATAPQSKNASVSVDSELRLVRSAVLYADEVELVSPGVEMIGNVAALGSGTEQDVIDLMLALDDNTLTHLGVGPSRLTQWRQALRGPRGRTPQARRLLQDAQEQFKSVADELMLDSGANELTLAMNAGLLRLSEPLTRDGGSDAMVARYVQKVRELVQNPRMHILFDDLTSSIVRGLIAEGSIEPNRLTIANAGEAAVGSGLIARLPAFDEAPLSEVLDLRRDLEEPLTRYRRSVAGMAGRLHVGPFDKELPADVDHLYISEVQPAIADLRDGLADHSLVREVARHLSVEVKPLVMGSVGSALALGAASLGELSGWATVAATGAPAGLIGVQAAVSGLVKENDERGKLKRHDLFYLYEVNNRLS